MLILVFFFCYIYNEGCVEKSFVPPGWFWYKVPPSWFFVVIFIEYVRLFIKVPRVFAVMQARVCYFYSRISY